MEKKGKLPCVTDTLHAAVIQLAIAVNFYQFSTVRPPAFLNALNFCPLFIICVSNKGVPHVHTDSFWLPWSLPWSLWVAVRHGGSRWEAGESIGELSSRHLTSVWKTADKSYVGGRVNRISGAEFWISGDNIELFEWNTWASLRHVLLPALFWDHCPLCCYNQKILKIPAFSLPLTTLPFIGSPNFFDLHSLLSLWYPRWKHNTMHKSKWHSNRWSEN